MTLLTVDDAVVFRERHCANSFMSKCLDDDDDDEVRKEEEEERTSTVIRRFHMSWFLFPWQRHLRHSRHRHWDKQ